MDRLDDEINGPSQLKLQLVLDGLCRCCIFWACFECKRLRCPSNQVMFPTGETLMG